MAILNETNFKCRCVNQGSVPSNYVVLNRTELVDLEGIF